MVTGVLWGAVAIASEQPLPPDTENRLGDFAELVSLAVASAQARTDLIASRARLVKAGDDQRRRLERNLHDGAQSRLVSVALQLRVARASLQRRPEAVPDLLAEAARELDAGLAELREIARGLHPAVLVEHGLAFALKALAERVAVPVTLEVPDERLPEVLEATAYYIASEALTNVAKHAEASSAIVTIERDGAVLRCSIADDGRGGADPAAGSGLLGLRDRAEAVGGTLSFVSLPGQGTTVVAALPLSSAAVVTSAMGQLKAATTVHHERLERRVDIERHLRSRAAYRALLERFYGFHRPVEAVLAPFAGPFTPRHPLLAQDIAALGGDVANLPMATRLPEVHSVRDALGVLYVLEGSALGGA